MRPVITVRRVGCDGAPELQVGDDCHFNFTQAPEQDGSQLDVSSSAEQYGAIIQCRNGACPAEDRKRMASLARDIDIFQCELPDGGTPLRQH